MKREVPDCMVNGYEELIDGLLLPDRTAERREPSTRRFSATVLDRVPRRDLKPGRTSTGSHPRRSGHV
jgi:hypothetical protein